MIVKARQLAGFDAQYVPGWDCHGLPIENAIEKKHGRNLSRDEMQAKSRAYATEQIALQMGDFKRLGILGEWDRRYATMDPANEAGEIRAFKRVIERGFVYRGLKPVYWCFDCGSSLAEFEIEYADKKSQTLDVGFLCAEPDRLVAAFGLDQAEQVVAKLEHKEAFAVIWTTTAWTHPRQPGAEPEPDAGLRAGRTPSAASCCCRPPWWRSAWRATACTGTGGGHHQGRKRWAASELPPSAGARRLRLRPPVARSTWPTTPPPTTAPASCTSVAGLWPGRLQLLRRARDEDRRDPQPGAGPRQLRQADFPLFGGQNIWKAVPVVIESAARCRSPARHRGHHAQLPALLAPQEPGDLPRRGAVVRPHGRRRRACSRRTRRGKTLAPDRRWTRSTQTELLPRERPRPPARHDRQPARLVHQPPAQLGRAAALLPAQGHGRAAPADDGDPRPRGPTSWRSRRHRAWSRTRRWKTSWGRRRAALHQEQRHPGGLVRQRLHLRARAARPAPRRLPRRPAPRPTCTWKATTSTAAGSTARCCWPARCTAARPTAGCSRMASRWTARAAR